MRIFGCNFVSIFTFCKNMGVYIVGNCKEGRGYMAHYRLHEKVQQLKTKTRNIAWLMSVAIAGLGVVLALPLAAGAAPSTVVYDNIPSPQPGNVPSQAFEATSTSEFGGQVQLAGTARSNPTITVLMSSWGCESGNRYSGNCSTTPGATFSEPITLNVYDVGASNAPGSIVATSTQTFAIPYRPSADNTNCTGTDAGKWFDGTTCYNGYATPISFSLSGVTLPSTVIISVAYNTSHYGYSPYGQLTTCYTSSGGCGYDSLNVGLTYSPTVGTDPLPSDAYINSTWARAYCSGSAGTFRLDSGCWTGYQPTFRVSASTPELVGSVTGGLTLSSPRQQISFNAFDYGPNSSSDYGTIEYQNFTYPGGLHYTANVLCATVSGKDARFMFQIPDGYPGLSGLYVVAAVHDGGSPGAKFDTYGHTATGDLATAMNWCENGAPVSAYTITGGNAVVHD